MRAFPLSLLAFVATALVFGFQTSPALGIFLMMIAAPLWSVVLINAGMIGLAVETCIGRVPRAWLIVPLAFYGVYFAFASADHVALYSLRRSYDAANARVVIPFDPAIQSLVFEAAEDGGWYTQNFALPVVYSVNPNRPELFLSSRMIERGICDKVRDSVALRAAGGLTLGFYDGDAIGSRSLEKRFCGLKMPEKPPLPQIRVTRREQQRVKWPLPVKQVTTTATLPDGRRFELRGGTASPLGWIPLPVLGCALNSGNASWDCTTGFVRNGFTPIVSGDTQYTRDQEVLARALRLRRVAIAERQATVPDAIRPIIAEAEKATLANQIADVDAMIADPIGRVGFETTVLESRPEELAIRANAIMAGLERAAAASGDDRDYARESGLILARLLAMTPEDEFAALTPRILAAYDRADRDHWLWRAGPLLQRLRDGGMLRGSKGARLRSPQPRN